MKRVVLAALLVALVALVVAGQHVWAGIMKRPPWTTELVLAALPALPWTQMPSSPSIHVELPFGFHARGAPARVVDGVTHLHYGFGDYRTQHPLGGGTTHQPLQVDVVVAPERAPLQGRFFNSAAFVAIGGGEPDRVDAGDVVVEHYDRTDRSAALRAVVVIDLDQRLRIEVVDQLQRFDEAGLAAFALRTHAAMRFATSRISHNRSAAGSVDPT